MALFGGGAQGEGRWEAEEEEPGGDGKGLGCSLITAVQLWASHSPGGLGSLLLSEELGGLFLRSFPGVNKFLGFQCVITRE